MFQDHIDASEFKSPDRVKLRIEDAESGRKRGRSSRKRALTYDYSQSRSIPVVNDNCDLLPGVPDMSGKQIDALDVNALRTFLKAAIGGIKAVIADAAKKERQNIEIFQSLESARADAAKLRADVAQNEKIIKELDSQSKKMHAELAAARERDTSLRVEAFEYNPKAICVFTSLDSYGTLVRLTDAIFGESETAPGGYTSREILEMQKNQGVPTKRGQLGRLPALNRMNRTFVSLMWLRQGLSFEALGSLFGVSPVTISRSIKCVLPVMSNFFKSFFPFPKRVDILKDAPPVFKECLGHDICFIIDGMEVQIQVSSNRTVQHVTYSNYKHYNTAKFLVAITPDGYIAYVSKAYGGRVSDVDLTRGCGFMDLLEPNSHVLADKGFTGVALDFLAKKCLLDTPYRCRRDGSQFSSEEMAANTNISHLRIHVERAINMIKDFMFLHKPIHIDQWEHIDDIMSSIRGLCNLRTPMTVKNE